MRWVIDNGVFTFRGHNAGIDASALGAGTHTAQFIGTDDGGKSASATTTFEVRYGRVAWSPGFTVVC